MKKTILRDVTIINEGRITTGSVLIEDRFIARIDKSAFENKAAEVIGCEGKWLLPGLIDDQVHFREPGLTHKGNIASESRAAVAGGVTSFMEMPNTVPGAVSLDLLEEKYMIASRVSPANYSFFLGTTNHNLDEIKRADYSKICGLKIFMGSSTGEMLVDNPEVLEAVFRECPGLIATHCESDPVMKIKLEEVKAKYGEKIGIEFHPVIRDTEVCYASSSFAVSLARKYGTRLHILHISTEKELELFSNELPLEDKKITAEACIHHLWFSDKDYAEKGNFIKWNPAIKSSADRESIRKAVNDHRIDVIATDHAPHTLDEKNQEYLKAPSGGPLVQHSLQALIDLHHQGVFSLETIVEKACHNPARLFRIENRGFIREGYFADLVLVDPEKPFRVKKENLLYHCGWSPFEGHTFNSSIIKTWVNGNLVWSDSKIMEGSTGERLSFRF
jgi:dihydroorotase